LEFLDTDDIIQSKRKFPNLNNWYHIFSIPITCIIFVYLFKDLRSWYYSPTSRPITSYYWH